MKELVVGISPLVCADLKSNLNTNYSYEPIVGPSFHSDALEERLVYAILAITKHQTKN